MKSFKKVILIDAINARSGGALVILDNVINQFIKHNKGDVKLIVTQLKSHCKNENENENVIRIGVDDTYYNPLYIVYWNFFKLPYILFKNNVSHLVAFSGFVFFRYFKRSTRVTVTVNNVIPFIGRSENVKYFPNMLDRIKFHALKKIYCNSLRIADRIVFPSYYLFGLVQKECKYLNKTTKVSLTGCDSNSVLTWEEEPEDKELVSLLYISPIWKYKNHAILIKALGYLKKNTSCDFKLYLIGGWPQEEVREELESIARLHDVFDSVVFLGGVNNQVKYEYLKKADILLFASKYEANSIILSEYLTYGKPIVSSNSASNKEVLKNSALYFNDSDDIGAASQIIRLTMDKKLRVKLLKNSRERAYQLKWDRYVLDLLDLNKKT